MCGQSGYITPTPLTVPKAWHGDQTKQGLVKPNVSGPKNGKALALSGVPNHPHKDNIKGGFINHAVSRANM